MSAELPRRYSYVGERPCVACGQPLQAGQRFNGFETVTVAIRPVGDRLMPVEACEHCGEGTPLRREPSDA